MPLQLYNTLTRRKETFQPLQPGQVNMYCCGMTVYDYCHLGHARSTVAWDILRRYLLWQGYRVTYAQNFTDIDDKILNRAKDQGTTMEAVSNRFIEAYFEDIRRLNVLDATHYPRATDHIDAIQTLIQALIDADIAYPAQGDVYYSVQQVPWYGKLSGRKLEDMQAGASGRLDNSPATGPANSPAASPAAGPAIQDPEADRKRYPFDFALWKAAKPGEPSWDSPWGPGRPGWHIECSAMIQAQFGSTIDIHGGGNDLIFPHHENEIAQSEGSTHQPLANYWLHNGMVNVDGQKMSKSLFNFTTIRGFLDDPGAPHPMVLRLFILQGHYRKPLDLTDEAIAAAVSSWATLQEGFSFGPHQGSNLGWPSLTPLPLQPEIADRFASAMDDDLNTPAALAILFELAKDLRRVNNILTHGGSIPDSPTALQQTWSNLIGLCDILGLITDAPASKPDSKPDSDSTAAQATSLSDSAIEALIADRTAAKAAKNWAEADRLRNQLKDQGIILVDQSGGSVTWHRT